MTTQEIASRLAELCRAGEFVQAQTELYGDEVVSIEPASNKEYDQETRGKEKVLAKIRKFMGSVDTLYGNEVGQPVVYNNAIAFTLVMDLKMKGGERMQMGEICVYQVKDGKVVLEQFFV